MGMTSGQMNVWRYTVTAIDVTENHSYDTYSDFENTYIANLVSGVPGCLVKIVFEDNTSIGRAGKWHIGTYINGVEQASIGERVGGNFYGSYGCDVYAGAKIHIYISTDVLDGIVS